MDKFNENLEQFLQNLSKITNDDFSEFYDFTQSTDEYLIKFYENCK